MTKIKAYKFAEYQKPDTEKPPKLNEISGQIGDMISAALSDVTGYKFKVDPCECSNVEFSKYVSSAADFASISLIQFANDTGAFLLRLDDQLVSILVDIFFGGSFGDMQPRESKTFSSIERKLIDGLAHFLKSQLQEVMPEGNSSTAHMLAHETEFGKIDMIAGDKKVIIQSFNIIATGKFFWSVDVILTDDLIKNLNQKKAINDSGADSEEYHAWQAGWNENIRQIHLPVRTVLAQPTMKIPELLDLQPGDIIPMVPRKHPPFFVADRKFAIGALGEQNGCAAFKLERFEQGVSA